jgi:hypothetical protein
MDLFHTTTPRGTTRDPDARPPGRGDVADAIADSPPLNGLDV